MNPIIPMWALTGHPTAERLISELENYKKCGIDQIMLYPRYGYEYEYMGEEWRRICHDCISFAHENGMKIWLYDEVNWPSGSCAGKVARVDESYRAKRLANENGNLVIETADPDTCRFAVDILNPKAVDCFISLTHEKYYEWFGEYFGGAVAGIFTDEPGFSYFAEVGKPAYYDGAFEEYRKMYGRNAEEDFISEYKNFYANWYNLLGIRFREIYLGRIAEWCEKRGIKLTGHLLYDNYIARGVHYTGDIIKALDRISVCGVDEIWNNPFHNHMDFAFSQIACLRKRGKADAMSELFAYGPASLPYARMRQMIWYAAAYGVNHFFTAIAHFDIRGNRVRKDFFHDFSPSSPDFFVGAPELVKSAAEATKYADKTPKALVSVRYPYRAALEASGNFGKECQAGKYLWALTKTLVDRQITFALVAEDETAETEICFEMNNEFITETSSGRIYTDAETAVSECIERIDRPVMLLESDGTLAENILLRTYTDGSFVAIERGTAQNAPSRNLILYQNGTHKAVALPSSGVITDQTPCFEPLGTPLQLGEVKVKYNEPSVLRAEFFLSDEYRFTLDEPMTLIFSKRTDEADNAVLLDGAQVDFYEQNKHLPIAVKEFYQNSKPIMLEAGEHVLATKAEEITHFPALLVFGDFRANGNRLTSRNCNLDEGIPFYSKITVEIDTDLPNADKPLYLTFEDNRLVSELTVDGERVGACAFAPYVYELPRKHYGKKVKSELSFYSGYAPLFGDLGAVNRQKSLSKNDTLTYSLPEKLILSGLCITDGNLSYNSLM